MIKKSVLGILIMFLVISSFSLLQAQENSTEEEKIDKAYSCLEDKIEENCDSLTTEEKIFSLLAINKCKTELIEDSSNEECWPSGNCKLKTTSQAVLALDNSNMDEAQQWILSQRKTPSELIWYLQIESGEQTTCKIDYEGFSTTIQIEEDKKISGDAGQCLSLAQDNYWLEISSFCYDKEISVSCDKDFSTTLLFQKQGSSIIQIFQGTSSAVAGGTTIEKVESFCFKGGQSENFCNYEASLWAALILNSLGEDISSYLPYLITLAEDNERFLPEAFLYLITNSQEYSNSLLSKQKKIGDQYYWQESSDKYYDTALALFPFKQETLTEKTNSKQWLLKTQDNDGCWLDNTRNTAFILASIWPRDFSGDDDDDDDSLDCISSGNYCVNKGSCEGQILSEYYCVGTLAECCTIPLKQQTCAEKGGIICSSNQICSGGDFISAANTNNCCINGGSCQILQIVDSECLEQGGTCRTSCLNDEQEVFYECEFAGDACCKLQTSPPPSFPWIWILLILIVLIIIGIIFKDKLRDFWFKTKSKFKKSKPRPKPGHRPYPQRRPAISPHYPIRKPVMRERRILPSLQRPIMPGKSPSKSQKELDDVLRKLKEMGK